MQRKYTGKLERKREAKRKLNRYQVKDWIVTRAKVRLETMNFRYQAIPVSVSCVSACFQHKKKLEQELSFNRDDG